MAIIGAGRLGSLLAGRMAGGLRKVIISRHRASAAVLADEVGGVASDHPSAVRGCDLVMLAIPGPAVPQVVSDISPFLLEGALTVNMATDVVTTELTNAFPAVRFAAAKLIGDAREMATGRPGLVVLDHVSPSDGAWLEAILAPLGPVVHRPESVVLAANTAIARAMITAEAQLQSQLTGLGLEPAHVRIALATAGPGILRSVATGEGGPFLTALTDGFRAEQ